MLCAAHVVVFIALVQLFALADGGGWFDKSKMSASELRQAAAGALDSASDLADAGIKGFGRAAKRVQQSAAEVAKDVDADAIKLGLYSTVERAPDRLKRAAADAADATHKLAKSSISALETTVKDISPRVQEQGTKLAGALRNTVQEISPHVQRHAAEMQRQAGEHIQKLGRVAKQAKNTIMTGAREAVWREACGSDPCQNSGTCVIGAVTRESYTCVCAEGWAGSNCDQQLACLSSPCLNGGSCTEEPGSNIESTRSAFSCSCTDLFEGDMCGRHVPSLWSVGDCALHLVLAVVSALVCFQYAPSIYSRALPAAAKAALAGALTQSRDYAVDITPSASLTCSSDGTGDQGKTAATSGDCEHSFRDTCPYTQTG